VALPSPLAEPVMSATFPSSLLLEAKWNVNDDGRRKKVDIVQMG